MIEKKTYMDKKKHSVLPWVTDWRSPQDHIRNSNDVKNMAFWDWYYCHPSSYKLQYYGINPIIMLMFSIPATWFIVKKWYYFVIIPGIFIGAALIDFVRKLTKRKQIGDTTFYDLHMRDYSPEPSKK